MKHERGVWLLRVLLVLFAAILVVLPVHAFISTWGGTAIGPLLVWKAWKEILLLIIVPLGLLYLYLRPDVLKLVWKGWLTKLILAYVALTAVMSVISQASFDAILAGAAANLRFFSIFVLAQILVASDDSWMHKLKSWLEPWLLGTAIFLAVLAIAQVTVIPPDFLANFGYDSKTTIAPYLLVDDNPDVMRAFATMRGPNPLGAYLLLALFVAAVAIFRQPRNMLAGLALGLGSVAMVLTHSRSAWLGLAVGLVVLAAISIHRYQLWKIVKWSIIPLTTVVLLLAVLVINVPMVRLAIFHSSPEDPTLFEGSSEKHWQATAGGFEDVLAHPLGQGVGTAGPASFYNTASEPKIAENYFVQLGQEIGIAGSLLFIAICVIVGYRLWQHRGRLWQKALLASLVGITVINVFQHGWADDPTAMTWWAIAGLFVLHDNRTKQARAT